MFPSNLTMGGKNARKFTGIRKYSTANKIRITMSGIQSKITMYTKKKKSMEVQHILRLKIKADSDLIQMKN